MQSVLSGLKPSAHYLRVIVSLDVARASMHHEMLIKASVLACLVAVLSFWLNNDQGEVSCKQSPPSPRPQMV